MRGQLLPLPGCPWGWGFLGGSGCLSLVLQGFHLPSIFFMLLQGSSSCISAFWKKSVNILPSMTLCGIDATAKESCSELILYSHCLQQFTGQSNGHHMTYLHLLHGEMQFIWNWPNLLPVHTILSSFINPWLLCISPSNGPEPRHHTVYRRYNIHNFMFMLSLEYRNTSAEGSITVWCITNSQKNLMVEW